MAIIYKTLFEVKILHEFYTSEQKGETIFDLAMQQDRLIFLQNKLAADLPSINKDLQFEIPEAARDLFRNHHVRIVPTYSGFKAGIKVKAIKQPDNSIFYQPAIALPDDTTFTISAQKRNHELESFTNGRLRRSIPAASYFTNENIPGAKTFPVLSGPVTAFNAGNTYEQGELASFGLNDIRAYFKDGGGDQWRTLNGSGFANEKDRMVVNFRFYYRFLAEDVTSATFTLKDSGGNTVRTAQVNSTKPLVRTRLDFGPKVLPDQTIDRLLSIPENAADTSILYTLNVSGSNGYTDTAQLIFVNDDLPTSEYWAMIQLKTKCANAAFNLLDAQGNLFTRKNPDSSIVPPPIFEIRVTSRFTYWRYINDKKMKFNIADYPNDFLDFTERALISKTPRPFTFSTVLFKKPDNTYHYLPHPQQIDLTRIENNQLYTDIIVPRSKLFPTVV